MAYLPMTTFERICSRTSHDERASQYFLSVRWRRRTRHTDAWLSRFGRRSICPSFTVCSMNLSNNLAEIRLGNMGRLTLLLGGIRSGKSAWGERLAGAEGPRVLYVATAEACDAEMRERIQLHRERRPASWTTVEEPLNPAGAIRAAGSGWDALLLDSISGWVANLMLANDRPDEDAPVGAGIGADSAILAKADELIAWLQDAHMPAVLISDEVGTSLVATTSAGRRFQDLIGLVNQRTAGPRLTMSSSLPQDCRCSSNPGPGARTPHDSRCDSNT